MRIEGPIVIAPSTARVDLLAPPKPGPIRAGSRRAPAAEPLQFDLEKKVFPTFPGLEAIADPKFPLKNASELREVASGASPSEPSTDGRKLRIPTNYLLKLDAPRLTATYPRPAIRARYCYRPKLMRGSLPGLQCGRVSVPCRAASSASHQGRRERFATSIRRQARQGDFRNVI